MSSSSDDEIGNQVEDEYENEKPIKKKSHSKGLSTGERARIIADAINQKQDPYYNATNKNGKWIVRKRKTPLPTLEFGELPEQKPIPQVSSQIEETTLSAQNHEDPNKQKHRQLKQQFFSMQNSINEDLKKSLNQLTERCVDIEKKYIKLKREKAKRKIEKEKKISRKKIKFEDEEEQPPPQQQVQQPQYTQQDYYNYINSLPPYARGRYLNINDF